MPTESYHEAHEADDEAYEADDEGYEADDEDDEDYAEDDESDDEDYEDDENYDEVLEADDEGYEADDEAYGEDDEAFSEALPPDALARAQARDRAQVRARAVASQRAMARQATADWKQLTQRISKIHGARAPRARGLSQVQGSSMVVATLPNGRKTRMRISPAPASASSVNRLRLQIASNDKRQAQAAAANAKAIDRLGAAQAAAVKKLTEQGVKSDRELTKRIIEGDAKLDKRISSEIAKAGGATSKQRRRMMMAIKRQQRRSLWNSILVASSLPFFAAYGDKENPFARDNLILTGSLVGWMLGDEIIDKVVGGRGKARSKLWSRTSDTWSYVAPVGNALTVWYLLKDRQHVRFLTGRSRVDYTVIDDGAGGITHAFNNGSNAITLSVAKDYQEDFAALASQGNVRAVATLVTTSTGDGAPVVVGVNAMVSRVGDSAVLTITPAFRQALVAANVGTHSFEVAWVVDTKDPAA